MIKKTGEKTQHQGSQIFQVSSNLFLFVFAGGRIKKERETKPGKENMNNMWKEKAITTIIRRRHTLGQISKASG